MTASRFKAYLELLLVAIIWGVAAPVIKFTLASFTPLVFLTYRFAISSLAALLLTLFLGISLPKNKKVIAILAIYGLLTSTIGLGLLFLGFDKTSAIDATLIGATGPILVATAGALFLHEHVTRREKIGISIAFAGTTVTILEPLLENGSSLTGLTGNLLVLASILVGVATAIMAKILLRYRVSPLDATHISFFTGFLTLAPLALLTHQPDNLIAIIKNAPPVYHLGVWFIALVSGNLAYTLWHKGQKTIEVGEAGLIAYLYPIFATPLSIFWLKETLSLPFIIGAIIITTGVYLAERRPRSIITS